MSCPDFTQLVLGYFLKHRRECSIEQLSEHCGLKYKVLWELSWHRNDSVNRSKIGNCWYFTPAAHYVADELAKSRGILECA